MNIKPALTFLLLTATVFACAQDETRTEAWRKENE